ncbi:MAG: LLM class flavin-dependent oxidoreductase, partial [Chloroflexia bacterium]|nr:LLM class flavin-dependent oxidoreductase [Chloroflexia bacterium]
MTRAYEADGVLIAVARPDDPYTTPTPAELVEIAVAGREARGPAAPWEIIIEGTTPTGDPAAASAAVQPLAEAGATWWIESPWEAPSVEGLRARIAAGPPR